MYQDDTNDGHFRFWHPRVTQKEVPCWAFYRHYTYNAFLAQTRIPNLVKCFYGNHLIIHVFSVDTSFHWLVLNTACVASISVGKRERKANRSACCAVYRPHCLMKTSSKQSKRCGLQLKWPHREEKQQNTLLSTIYVALPNIHALYLVSHQYCKNSLWQRMNKWNK